MTNLSNDAISLKHSTLQNQGRIRLSFFFGLIHKIKRLKRKLIAKQALFSVFLPSFSRGLNSHEKREKRIIVSLTTIPSRIKHVSYTIETMFRQTCKPDKILLFLGEEEFCNTVLPPRLLRLKKKGIEIIYCKDLKPHKKYFYTMQMYPEDIVITIDDDVLYNYSLIEQLMCSYRRFPHAVSAMRARMIAFNEDRSIQSYKNWKSHNLEIQSPSFALVSIGIGGVIYPPHSLHPEVFNETNLINLCLFADDIWLKIMELMNNTPVVLVSSKSYYQKINGIQKIALKKTNLKQDMNDVYLARVLKVYDTFSHMIDCSIQKKMRVT